MLWLPHLDARVVRLMADPTGLAALKLDRSQIRFERVADDGRHLLFGMPINSSAALALPGAAWEAPLAAIVPLDLAVPHRIEALLRLWRRLAGRPPGHTQSKLTAIQRQRLAMMLRAVDGRRAGATRRDIAQVLFGRDQIPDGTQFDDHHLRSRTARLIRDGLAMIAGGYRKLLKD